MSRPTGAPPEQTARPTAADAYHGPGRGRLRARAPRGTSWWLKETVLTVLALGGAACVLAVFVSHALGLSLVMFRTGSMAPAIPAGSVAVVREIPANQAQVGDVLTVERSGHMPVTHRVVAVDEVRPDGTVTFRMRGDANPVDDPQPYVAERVRRVEASLAGVAPLVAATGRPPVIAAVTLTVTALVTWTLWPRRSPERGSP